MATTELPVRPAAEASTPKLPIDKLDDYPNCDPSINPLDAYRAHIATLLHQVTGVDPKIILPAIQRTQSLDKGDLIVAVPALRVKGKKPDEQAKEWVEKFPESPLIEKPSAAGTFIQFFFKGPVLANFAIPTIRAQGPKFGENPTLGLKDPQDPSKGKKRAIVEFSSPNIAKQFHHGHLRSTIIGSFLANLYETCGWEVIKMNYLGDWGKQYGLLALGFEKWGDEKALAEDPVLHLYQLYVKINAEVKEEEEKIESLIKEGNTTAAEELRSNGVDEQARKYFKKMVDRDEKALANWQRFRDASIVRYKAVYARLGIYFDVYAGESQVSEEDMANAMKTLTEKGIAEEADGALMIDFTKHVPGKQGKSLGKTVIRKKDGTALYLTRDISELLARYTKFKFDKLIYVVGDQQNLHMQQLFKIIELMGYKDVAEKSQHVNFGKVAGMSSRSGKAVFLDDTLASVGDKMHEVMKTNVDKYNQVEDPEATADTLGISSIMVQDMTGKRINGYTFDMDRMTSFEGDTGPYLQYAHARLNSISRKAKISPEEVATANLDLLTEDHAINLVRMLVQYPDVVANTYKVLEPCTMLVYLFKMAHVLSSSYDHLQVVGSERELSKARMALYEAVRVVLANGMRLLGLKPVERM